MVEVNAPDIKSLSIQSPTEKTGEYRPLLAGQTVCNVLDEKGQKCTGHVKQWFTAPPEVVSKAAPGNTIHRCQRCFAIYEGPAAQYLYPKILK